MREALKKTWENRRVRQVGALVAAAVVPGGLIALGAALAVSGWRRFATRRG